uniref:TROVE domain-containing protein n=1 Tax=Ditylenchus dipsaci TaxID=166011 RepID=A0A915DUH2_9BILA
MISNIEQGERLLSQLRLSHFHISQLGLSKELNESPRQMKQMRDDEVSLLTDKLILTHFKQRNPDSQRNLENLSSSKCPQQNFLLYALALCARYNVKDRRNLLGKVANTTANPTTEVHLEKLFDEYILSLQQASLMAVNEVCNIPTHLFAFVKYADMFSKKFANTEGWGRGMKKVVSKW